jgi:hypothetical protein
MRVFPFRFFACAPIRGANAISRHGRTRPFTIVAIGTALGLASPAVFAQSSYQAMDLSFPGNFGSSAVAVNAGQAVG